MKLNKNNIEINTNENGEISSIKFKGKEILHTSKEWWAKTYPMIWPNTSFSRSFVVDKKNYELPKHGFWKEMKWQQIFEDESLVMLSTHTADERYPFTIDIQNKITIKDDQIEINTTFANLSPKMATFRFGHHPAFIIDNDSILDTSVEGRAVEKNGWLSQRNVENKKLAEIPFGKDFDTISYKDVPFSSVSFNAQGLNIRVSYEDFDDLQVWRPENAKFICIEPWQGWNDDEYDSPSQADEKIGSININSGESITYTVKIDVSILN